MNKNNNKCGFLISLLFFGSISFCFGFVPGFNTVGYFQSEAGMNTRSFKSCLIDSNKKILTVGRTDNRDVDDHDGLIVRFNTDGTLDKTFNTTGFLSDDIVTESYFYHDIALDNQGNIVVVGRTNRRNNDSNEFYRLIVRYKPDGTLDPSFAVGGVEGGGGENVRVQRRVRGAVTHEARAEDRKKVADDLFLLRSLRFARLVYGERLEQMLDAVRGSAARHGK